MFLSRRVRCSLKYVESQSYKKCQLKSHRFLKSLVNKEYYSETTKPSCFHKEHSSQISTASILLRDHSTKGWKFKARDGEIPIDLPKDACEEGKGAIPHSVLVSELQNCSSVSAQIELFCSLLSITSEDMERRRAFCQSLHEALSPYFPQLKVTKFGSSSNGLGFKGCDTDVCLQTTFNNEGYVILKEVPSLSSVIDGTISKETLSRMTPLYMLRFVRRILREHCPDVKEPILLVKARCPILRFYNEKYDVFCDFSCENKNSLRNTMLLRLLCGLDEKFTKIAKVIRYWGKYGGFVGDIEMFNSYSFSLLVVHFLQTRSPPVLPPIQEIIKKSEYMQSTAVNDTDLLLKDLKKFSPSQNTKTVEELLKEFYFYFLTFDFSRVILLFSSSTVPKSNFVPERSEEDIFEFSAVNIQDPFRRSFNVAGGTSFRSGRRFLNSLMEACEAYQNNSLWTPKAENWGLSSLFYPPIKESKMMQIWKEKRFHTIDLPAVPDATKKLKNILEYGLLFHCTEFRINNDSNRETNSQMLLKLHCKAHENTWQGRDWAAQNCQTSTNSALEKEHFISKQLVNKTAHKRLVLCEFKCECFEVKDDNNTKLVLQLNFMESNFPPIVAIFLKDFLPSVFRKL